MSWVYFNAAVNSGPGKAASLYKKSGGDYKKFLTLQTEFYEAIVAKRPNQGIFLKGWLNRIHSLSSCIEKYSVAKCKGK